MNFISFVVNVVDPLAGNMVINIIYTFMTQPFVNCVLQIIVSTKFTAARWQVTF